MISDIILVSSNPEVIVEVAEWVVNARRRFFLLDVGCKYIPSLPPGSTITIIKPYAMEHISDALNGILCTHITASWVFIISDDTFKALEALPKLERVAPTIPRLASLNGVNIPGLVESKRIKLFGTLYSSRVLNDVSQFYNCGDNPPDKVFESWWYTVKDKGWTHMSTFIEQEFEVIKG